MNSKGMAENIATVMREQDEHITALKAVLSQKLNPQRLAALEREVQVEIARVRAEATYRESAAQFQHELDDAKDDNALISVLHSWSLCRSNVGSD
jgi:hypothetical protein